MRYFFIFGQSPGISAVEVMGVIEGSTMTVTELFKDAMILESKEGLDADTKKLMSRLGGTVKIGRLIKEDLPIEDGPLIETLVALGRERGKTGKVTFGLSTYALSGEKPAQVAAKVAMKFKRIGMEAKRLLKEEGISCRWVQPQQGYELSSVAVQKNGMTEEQGFECVILVKDGTMRIGITEAVQPFQRFSDIDYGRPARDMVQGMLPPKLARIMLNIGIVRPAHRILDPFCGSGTVLTEAMQLGVRKLVGSDLNPAAVESTKKNIAWMHDQGYGAKPEEVNVFESDARKVSEHLEKHSIDAIITEPYLGPPRTGKETRSEVQKRLHELTNLYLAALQDWKHVVKPGGPIIVALPVYIMGLEKHGIMASDFSGAGYETEPLFPDRFLQRMGVKPTKNKGLLYGRNDQHVWREIVRMRAKH